MVLVSVIIKRLEIMRLFIFNSSFLKGGTMLLVEISFKGAKRYYTSIVGDRGKKICFYFDERNVSLASEGKYQCTNGSLKIEFFRVGKCEYIIVKLCGKICFVDGYRYLSGYLHYIGEDESFYLKINNTPIYIKVVKKW